MPWYFSTEARAGRQALKEERLEYKKAKREFKEEKLQAKLNVLDLKRRLKEERARLKAEKNRDRELLRLQRESGGVLAWAARRVRPSRRARGHISHRRVRI